MVPRVSTIIRSTTFLVSQTVFSIEINNWVTIYLVNITWKNIFFAVMSETYDSDLKCVYDLWNNQLVLFENYLKTNQFFYFYVFDDFVSKQK